jgi:hypothetical protein
MFLPNLLPLQSAQQAKVELKLGEGFKMSLEGVLSTEMALVDAYPWINGVRVSQHKSTILRTKKLCMKPAKENARYGRGIEVQRTASRDDRHKPKT